MTKATSDYAVMRTIALNICSTVEEKGEAYGDSWRARGGAGAFMVMARKWDRIENICRGEDWDIFDVLNRNQGDMRDDVEDLIGYLLLILEHTTSREEVLAPGELLIGYPWPLGRTLENIQVTTSNEHWSNEGYYGDNTELYKCRHCGATRRQAGTPTSAHPCDKL